MEEPLQLTRENVYVRHANSESFVSRFRFPFCSKISASGLFIFAVTGFGIIFEPDFSAPPPIRVLTLSSTGALIGYMIAVQPVLEKRLILSSSLSGVLLSSVAGGLIIGLVLTILFVPQHQPLWLAGSVQLCGIFTVLTAITLSQFEKRTGTIWKNVNETFFCDESFLNSTIKLAPKESNYVDSEKGTAFTVGVFLWLTGVTAALPCVVAINQAILSSRILLVLFTSGPIAGFLMGACYKDSYFQFGGFIVGLIVVGVALNILGLIVGLIPKASIKTSMTVIQERLPGSNISFKNTAKTIGAIFRNITFLGLSGTLILDILATACYVFVLPRYLQIQFDVEPAISNIAVAFGVLLPYGLGAFVFSFGGHFLRLTANNLRMISVTCVGLSCFGYLIFIFLGCGPAEFDHERQIAIQQKQTFVVENICNDKCDCFRMEHYFRPVCHIDTHVTFASPCLAGCMKWNEKEKVFEDCHCVENKAKDDQLPASTTSVTEGFCSRNCAVAFSTFVFLGCLFHIHAGFPIVTILQEFSSLFVEQESAIISKQLLLLVIISLGILPAPIISGFVVDATCLLWDSEKSRVIGGPVCVFHDGDWLRTHIHVPLLFTKLVLTACYYLIYRYLNQPAHNNDTETDECTVYYKSVVSTSTLDLVADTEE